MTKIKFLFFTLLCAVMTLQTSCSSGDDSNGDDPIVVPPVVTVTGINLNKTVLSVQVGKTETLGASLLPAGVTGNIVWSVQDPTVATVTNAGVVTGVKAGTTNVVAAIGAFSATCAVTVTAEPVVATDNSLSGSDYYVIQLDDISYAAISGKVIKDLRPDEVNKHLYVWEGTFVPGTPAGTNFYGQSAGWVSLNVTKVGWSGAGWKVDAPYGNIDMTRMFANPADYYLHIGIKTTQAGKSFAFILNDGSVDGKFALGGDFNDNGTIYKSLGAITRDGKWNGIDIPVTELNKLGLNYNKAFTDKNVLAVLAGGAEGTTLDLDAVFFYKKAK
jgi:hypothetical protein